MNEAINNILKKVKSEEEEEKKLNPKGIIVTSTHHTLFVKPVESEAKQVGDLYEVTPPYNEYILYVGDFAEETRGSHEILNSLRHSKPGDVLSARIHSWGGSCPEGIQLINLINEKFLSNNVLILDSIAYSMGALLFCSGRERVVYENSSLMFHDYSHMVWGKGGEIESQTLHNAQYLRNFFYSTIVSNGFLTDQEFEEMLIGKDFWMDSVEMCRRGVATDIIVADNKFDANLYIKFVDKEISIEELMSGEINTKPETKKKKSTKKVTKKTPSKKNT